MLRSAKAFSFSKSLLFNYPRLSLLQWARSGFDNRELEKKKRIDVGTASGARITLIMSF